MKYTFINRIPAFRVKDNYTATAAPTVNDDRSAGYSVGSTWFDTTSVPHEIYRCADSTVGAAIWLNTSLELADLGSMAVQDANAVNISGGSITGITDLTVADGGTGSSSFAANTLLKGNDSSALALSGITDDGTTVEIPRTTNVGTNVAGKNLTVKATLTSIHTFSEANWNEDDATWTMTGTGPLVHVAGNTTTITATNTETIVAGTTYKVTITGTGGGGTATYTLGGVTGTTIAASGAIAITDWITVGTTASLIITPATACTVSITSITIEKATDATGDVTVEGNLYVRSPVAVHPGAPTYPSIYFPSYGTTYPSAGFYQETSSTVDISFNGTRIYGFSDSIFYILSDTAQINMGMATDVKLYRQAANHLMHRNAANVNTVSIANTYTNSSNYEYQSLTGVAGTSFNWTANTLGTGGDNIDMVVTPAGTGVFSTGTAAIRGAVGITTHSATEAATSATMYGDTHRVTGAYTITLPNVAVGMSATFRATTAAVLTLDCDATDAFILNGTALTAGNKLISSGLAGESVYLEVTVDNQIDVYPMGVWADGGA